MGALGESRKRLTSWKDIARHLERDVRTVMRWEKERSLPVHRVPGPRPSRVWAYADELTAWLAAAPPEEAAAPPPVDHPPAAAEEPAPSAVTNRTRRLLYRWAAGVAALALVTAAVVIARRPAGPIVEILAGEGGLRAVDHSRRTLWSFRVPDAVEVSTAGRWWRLSDLDGDGRSEVIAAVNVTRAGRTLTTATLYCFSDDGRLKWSHTPSDAWRFGNDEYLAPWGSTTVSVVMLARGTRVAWAVHHHTWWPSMLLLLDARGASELAFINAGYLSDVGASMDGRRLFVTGISNSQQKYFMAMLDADRPGATSPEQPGSEFECRTCPPGRPLVYYAFPRTEASRAIAFPAEPPSVFVEGDRTQVWVKEAPGPVGPATIYDFAGAEFTAVRARFADSYWEWHRDAERRGPIDHAAADCPERASLTVSRWSDGHGWTALRLPTSQTVLR
jgi:hypothetical protein